MQFTFVISNLAVAGTIVLSNSYADTLGAEKEILNLIGAFSERICPNIEMKGSSSSLELSGNAKAELDGLLKKMTAMGIQGAAKYQESQYQGVLQKDLANAAKDSAECKLKVANSLMGNLLGASVVPRLPESVREELSKFLIEGSALREQFESRIHQQQRELLPQTVTAVQDWHNRVLSFLDKPPLGMTYVARFKNKSRSTATYPSGMPMKVSSTWNLLQSDLQRLDEFMRDR